MKTKYHEIAESVKLKQTATRQKLKELQHAGDSALKDIKSGFDLAYSAMGEAIDSARSRFR